MYEEESGTRAYGCVIATQPVVLLQRTRYEGRLEMAGLPNGLKVQAVLMKDRG